MNNLVIDNGNRKTITSTNVLIWGIISAASAFEFGLPGIIFGCVTRKKVKKFLNENDGQTCTKVMLGSILSKVGIYAGIGLTVYLTVFLLIYLLFLLLVFVFEIGILSDLISAIDKVI